MHVTRIRRGGLGFNPLDYVDVNMEGDVNVNYEAAAQDQIDAGVAYAQDYAQGQIQDQLPAWATPEGQQSPPPPPPSPPPVAPPPVQQAPPQYAPAPPPPVPVQQPAFPPPAPPPLPVLPRVTVPPSKRFPWLLALLAGAILYGVTRK